MSFTGMKDFLLRPEPGSRCTANRSQKAFFDLFVVLGIMERWFQVLGSTFAQSTRSQGQIIIQKQSPWSVSPAAFISRSTSFQPPTSTGFTFDPDAFQLQRGDNIITASNHHAGDDGPDDILCSNQAVDESHAGSGRQRGYYGGKNQTHPVIDQQSEQPRHHSDDQQGNQRTTTTVGESGSERRSRTRRG